MNTQHQPSGKAGTGQPEHRVHRTGPQPQSPEPRRPVTAPVPAHLKPLRSATIDLNGVIATFPPALNPEGQAILDALRVDSSGTKPNDPTRDLRAALAKIRADDAH